MHVKGHLKGILDETYGTFGGNCCPRRACVSCLGIRASLQNRPKERGPFYLPLHCGIQVLRKWGLLNVMSLGFLERKFGDKVNPDWHEFHCSLVKVHGWLYHLEPYSLANYGCHLRLLRSSWFRSISAQGQRSEISGPSCASLANKPNAAPRCLRCFTRIKVSP